MRATAGWSRKVAVGAVAAGALAVGASCAPLGAVAVGGGGGGVGGGYSSAVLEGEVRHVDTRRSRIHLVDHRNRSQAVHFDRRTQVVYRQRQYRVTNLEPGDLVRVRVVRDRNGAYWADRVDVRQSVRERYGYGVRVERLDGVVARTDLRRGWLAVEPRRGQQVVVYLPQRLSAADERRLQRLRRGDRVSIDVRPVGRSEAELVRFR